VLSADDLQRRVQEALPGAEVVFKDLTGTGDHFEARVVSAGFAGKSMIEQHQAVYAPLQDVLRTGELHALVLKTYTPEQWARIGANPLQTL
jgi:acid stress-induced BolA-like protein IbaG/YrbA